MITLLLAALAPAQTATAASPPALPSDPLSGDWLPIPPEDLLVLTLTGARTVVIRLAARCAPEHGANVRRLALAHYWDGTSHRRSRNANFSQQPCSVVDVTIDAVARPIAVGA